MVPSGGLQRTESLTSPSLSYLQLFQHLEGQQLLPKIIPALDNDRQEPPIGEMAIGGALSDPPAQREAKGVKR